MPDIDRLMVEFENKLLEEECNYGILDQITQLSSSKTSLWLCYRCGPSKKNVIFSFMGMMEK
jgi:hypothetical protein